MKATFNLNCLQFDLRVRIGRRRSIDCCNFRYFIIILFVNISVCVGYECFQSSNDFKYTIHCLPYDHRIFRASAFKFLGLEGWVFRKSYFLLLMKWRWQLAISSDNFLEVFYFFFVQGWIRSSHLFSSFSFSKYRCSFSFLFFLTFRKF